MELSQNHESEPGPSDWAALSWTHLSTVRSTSPLIQCITNYVAMDITANVLLAAGASPAMLHSLLEIPDFTPKVRALCLNLGTLSDDWVPSMRPAAEKANEGGIPWVLDPVAVAASGFRMEVALGLVRIGPTVVRGNASEIRALAAGKIGEEDDGKGVDSIHESIDAVEAAKSLALSCGAIVAVSGAVDYITDGKRVVGVKNGVPMLQKITATGCAVTALIAAFVAVDLSHALEATACALSIFGVAGELGMEMAKGPASLRVHLIDSLYGLKQQMVSDRVSIVDIT